MDTGADTELAVVDSPRRNRSEYDHRHQGMAVTLFSIRMALVLLTLVCTAPVFANQVPAREIEASVSAETAAETEADAAEDRRRSKNQEAKKTERPQPWAYPAHTGFYHRTGNW